VPALRIRIGARTFAPGLVPTLLMLPVLALLLGLGTWQLGRAEEKRALFEAFARGTDATSELPPASRPAPRYTHVRLEGRYLPGRQVLLDNVTHAERVGYRVLTPLEREDGETVLVDRGWVPLGRSRAVLPDVAVDAEPRAIAGRVDALPRAGIDLEAPEGSGWPRVASFPSMPELERALGRPLYPQIVLLDADQPDGYVREWRPPGLPPERHLGYAVQWYSLATALVVIWIVVNTRRTAE
jgi:surfeit locus 1 family protein